MAKPYEASANINRLTSWMARRGWGRTEVLTTTGRMSGKSRQVPVSPIELGGSEYLVAPYGEVAWVRNVRSDPNVTLRHGSSERRVRLEEVAGHVATEAVAAYYARETFPRPYMDVPDNPTTADFAATAGRFPVFRVEARG
ncbi:MAG TPA: nitroreductase family deazaflavin-dependent oxidoreductase [Acidimicrobiia bacterium]|nr:nitroreductase family deazaflavin-dependent oxidoreductase [Acidimicrobiia bacterium]